MEDNQAPSVTISSPSNGAEFDEGESITFEGSAEDPEEGSLTGESLTWEVRTDAPFGTGEPTTIGSGEEVSSVLSSAPHTVTLIATDPSGATARDSVSVAVDGPPAAVISAPEDESAFDEGSDLTLEGRGIDPISGEVSGDSLEWSSDVNGDLGRGESVIVSNLSAGPQTMTLTATDDDGNTASNSAHIVVESPGFDVRFSFQSEFTSSQKETIRNAFGPWEAAITEDLAPVFSPSDGDVEKIDPALTCLPEEKGIDDLAIVVQKQFLDGSGGTLAQAGPCLMRTDDADNFITSASGSVLIDEADLDNENLKDIITHEIGHALGIGIESVEGWGSNTSSVGNPNRNDPRTVNPFHEGTNTLEAFEQLGGSEAYLSEGVPLENIGGAGTAGSHWRQAAFGGNNFETELMTGFINPNSDLPLSRVSLAALQDIGYEVDLSTADDFALPMPQEAIWRPVADATLSRSQSSDDNFGGPDTGTSVARLDSFLVAGSNNGRLWSMDDPEREVFTGVVRFDVPSSLPVGINVVSAVGNLVVADRNAETSDHDVIVSRIGESWSEGNVTWDNRPAIQDTVDAFDFESCERCLPDVTDVATDWLTGNVENNGIALRAPDASSDTTFSVGFFSRHVDFVQQNPLRKPVIVVFAETGSSSLTVRPQSQDLGLESEDRIPLKNDIRSGTVIGVDADGHVVRTERIRPSRIP